MELTNRFNAKQTEYLKEMETTLGETKFEELVSLLDEILPTLEQILPNLEKKKERQKCKMKKLIKP